MSAADLTIERLERWQSFGAHWRLVQITDARAVVDLCACTGEPVERAETVDAAVISYLRFHPGGGSTIR
jgi:hypothetical protein